MTSIHVYMCVCVCVCMCMLWRYIKHAFKAWMLFSMYSYVVWVQTHPDSDSDTNSQNCHWYDAFYVLSHGILPKWREARQSVWYVCVYVCVYVYAHVYADMLSMFWVVVFRQSEEKPANPCGMYVYMYMHMHFVCTQACKYDFYTSHVRIHTHTHTHTHVCTKNRLPHSKWLPIHRNMLL